MGIPNAGLMSGLERLYGSGALAQCGRYAALAGSFRQAFREEPRMFFSVPGRSELGGNHTDHQNGCVLTAAVDLDTVAAVRRDAGALVRVSSEGYEPFEVDLGCLEPVPGEEGTSAALVRGIAAYMAGSGYKTGGFSAAVSSNVLPGSGLSSSASFEVLIGAIFSGLFNDNAVPPVEIAKTAQNAENEFFGKPCGLQDQMACALGGISYIDFKSTDEPKYEKIPFLLKEQGYAMCILNTGKGHAGLTEAYADIPEEMQSVARRLGQEKLRFCDAEVFFRSIPDLRGVCGDRAVLRAYHFFTENERPKKMAAALLGKDFSAYLALVNESGRSSWQYLQNVCVPGEVREQPLGAGLAVSERVLKGRGACRVHGGGFAGTIQAYVPTDLLKDYRDTMEAVFGKGSCFVLNFREAGPASIES